MTTWNEIFAYVGISFAIVSLGLVSGWAQYNPSIQEQWGALPLYLGIPNWRTEPFAWHVVLFVAGYFLCQVLSLTTIVLGGVNKTAVAIFHIFWEAGALCFLISGMRAVVKWKYQNGFDSLSTLHGWIGVITIIMFFFSYLFSNGVALGALVLKSNLSNSTTWVHMCFSIISLMLTFICIITGVEAWNGYSGCAFVSARMNPDHTALNSAFYYGKNYPWSCKLSNGMGITVMFATFFTVVALMASSSVALFESKEHTHAAIDHGVELGETGGAGEDKGNEVAVPTGDGGDGGQSA